MLQSLARQVVKVADEIGSVEIIPIGQRDLLAGCIIRFRLGTIF